MPESDPIGGLILEVLGEAETKRLQQAIDAEKAAILALDAQLRAHDITQQQFATAAGGSAARLAALHDQLRATERTAGVATNKMAGFGQSMLQGSRAVQDFQAAGLAGITNNIESIALALGLSGGLAGILTLVTVGFQVALPHIKSFFQSLRAETVTVVTSRLEELKTQIKELTEKPLKLGVDFAELDKLEGELARLTKAKAALDAILSKKTPQEEATEKHVAEQLGTPEGKAAIGKVEEQIRGERERQSPELQAERVRIARLQQEIATQEKFAGAGEGGELTLQTLREQLAAARVREANAARRAATDAGNEKALLIQAGGAPELIRRLGEVGETGLAERLSQVPEPETAEVKKQKRDEEQAERDRLRTAAELAAPLQDRLNIATLSGKPPGRGGVKAELIAAGQTEAEAEEHVDAVLEALNKGLTNALRRKRGELGGSLQEAGAALVAEAGEKQAKTLADLDKEINDARKGKEQEEQQASKDAVARAREQAPEAAILGQQFATDAIAAGQAPGSVEAKLREMLSFNLQGAGLSKDEAGLAAEDIARDATRQGREDAIRKLADDDRTRKSIEIIQGTDIASTVQRAAQGQDPQERSAKLLERIDKHLEAQNRTWDEYRRRQQRPRDE